MLLQMVRGGAMKGGPAHGRTREHRQHCGGRAQAAARRTRGSNHGCIPRRTRQRICPPSVALRFHGEHVADSFHREEILFLVYLC